MAWSSSRTATRSGPSISVRAPQGTNIHETDRIVRLIEERIKPFQPWIEHTVTNVGSTGGVMDLTSSAGGPHLAGVTLVFYDYAIRERPSMEVIAGIREAIADIPGAEIKVERQKDGPPTGAPVTVRISGEDFKTLEQYSEQAKKMIEDVPNLVNLRSDLEATRPELAFTVDRRRAVLLGVNTATVGNFLKMAIFGTKVGHLPAVQRRVRHHGSPASGESCQDRRSQPHPDSQHPGPGRAAQLARPLRLSGRVRHDQPRQPEARRHAHRRHRGPAQLRRAARCPGAIEAVCGRAAGRLRHSLCRREGAAGRVAGLLEQGVRDRPADYPADPGDPVQLAAGAVRHHDDRDSLADRGPAGAC